MSMQVAFHPQWSRMIRSPDRRSLGEERHTRGSRRIKEVSCRAAVVTLDKALLPVNICKWNE